MNTDTVFRYVSGYRYEYVSGYKYEYVSGCRYEYVSGYRYEHVFGYGYDYRVINVGLFATPIRIATSFFDSLR